ncbi:hypothetical protein [Streptomyces purpureus]|uniref:hypothetical protein n=1 Tax=Streptomyces purpureus TaxID=1951 RepID=UPI0003714AB1|nr:hypothetical protein [Streptomyces purpureus]
MKTPRMVLAVALLTWASACAAPGPSEERGARKNVSSEISLQKAAEMADAIMLDTVSSAKPPLNWVHDASTESGCGAHTIDGKKTASATRRAAVMTVVSEARRGSLLGVVERQWKKRGYEITGTNSDKQFPAIFARTSDDFRMSVVVGAKGQFFFEVITPCFVDSEVEPPKTEDNGTPFEGSTVPYPSVRSDFWSLDTPVSSTP